MVSEQNNTVVNTLFKYPDRSNPTYTKLCKDRYIAPNSLMCTLFQNRESLEREKDIKRNGTTREIREQEWTHTFTDWAPFRERGEVTDPNSGGTRLRITTDEDVNNHIRFFGVSYEETRRVNGQAVNVPAKITGTANINTSVASLRQRGVRRGQYLALDADDDGGGYFVNVDKNGISGYEDHYQISLRPAKPEDYGNGLLVGRFDGYADASQNSIRVVLQMYGVCPVVKSRFDPDDLYEIYKGFMETAIGVSNSNFDLTGLLDRDTFEKYKGSLFDNAAMMSLLESFQTSDKTSTSTKTTAKGGTRAVAGTKPVIPSKPKNFKLKGKNKTPAALVATVAKKIQPSGTVSSSGSQPGQSGKNVATQPQGTKPPIATTPSSGTVSSSGPKIGTTPTKNASSSGGSLTAQRNAMLGQLKGLSKTLPGSVGTPASQTVATPQGANGTVGGGNPKTVNTPTKNASGSGGSPSTPALPTALLTQLKTPPPLKSSGVSAVRSTAASTPTNDLVAALQAKFASASPAKDDNNSSSNQDDGDDWGVAVTTDDLMRVADLIELYRAFESIRFEATSDASSTDLKDTFEAILGKTKQIKGKAAVLRPLKNVKSTDAAEEAIRTFLDKTKRHKDQKDIKTWELAGASVISGLIHMDTAYNNAVFTSHVKEVYKTLGGTEDTKDATRDEVFSKLKDLVKKYTPSKLKGTLNEPIYRQGDFKQVSRVFPWFDKIMERALIYVEKFGVYANKKFEPAEKETLEELRKWYSAFKTKYKLDKILSVKDTGYAPPDPLKEAERSKIADDFNNTLKDLLSGKTVKIEADEFVIAQFKDTPYTLPYNPTMASMDPKDPIVESVVVEAKKERKTKRRKKEPIERPSDPIVVEMDVDGK